MYKFDLPLAEGTIIKRYKRFLSDIRLDSGELITAHTPNTGSMKTCWEEGWRVLVSKSDNPKRKLPYTLEMTHNGKTWIGVNTARPNTIVFEALQNKEIPELKDLSQLKREYKYGQSRIDIYGEDKGQKPCLIEIKNVTLKGAGKWLEFPDAVTTRGKKHLQELTKASQEGFRAIMFFLVQREDGSSFRPAWEIDPAYAKALKDAQNGGVEVLVYQCQLSKEGIKLAKRIPLSLEKEA